MRITLLLLLTLFSFPAYAGCGCSGNVYLHLIYQDKAGNRHDVRVFGRDWPLSLAETLNSETYFKNRLKAGESFEVVMAARTLPFNTKKHGVVSAPFVVRTGVKLNKTSITMVERVELLKAGCAAYPSSVFSGNMSTVSTTKPVRVETRADKNYGGISYRIYFKKESRVIWLNYYPDRGRNCPGKTRMVFLRSETSLLYPLVNYSNGHFEPAYKDILQADAVIRNYLRAGQKYTATYRGRHVGTIKVANTVKPGSFQPVDCYDAVYARVTSVGDKALPSPGLATNFPITAGTNPQNLTTADLKLLDQLAVNTLRKFLIKSKSSLFSKRYGAIPVSVWEANTTRGNPFVGDFLGDGKDNVAVSYTIQNSEKGARFYVVMIVTRDADGRFVVRYRDIDSTRRGASLIGHLDIDSNGTQELFYEVNYYESASANMVYFQAGRWEKLSMFLGGC